jgi:hypothetical protein
LPQGADFLRGRNLYLFGHDDHSLHPV